MSKTVLVELSDALADAAERAGQSTVLVNARRRMPASGIIFTADLVLTADHVIEREDELSVIEGLKYLPTAILPAIYDPSLVDRHLGIDAEETWAMTRRLSRQAGLFVGLSSGAAMVGAIQIARSLDEGVVVTLLPDDGSKYVSLGLFDRG